MGRLPRGAYQLSLCLHGGCDLPRRLPGVCHLTQAVRSVLQERLRRVRAQQVTPLRSLVETLDEIAVRGAALPDLDTRSPNDILGYEAHGLPH